MEPFCGDQQPSSNQMRSDIEIYVYARGHRNTWFSAQARSWVNWAL